MRTRRFATLSLSLFFLAGAFLAGAENGPAKTEDQPPAADATVQPTPTTNANPAKPGKSQQPGKVLFIHKPMPSPSWGKVIQYHRDQILALSEKNRETIHEFLFQDDSGIIRTASFHENSSGEGYWEVWIWDQP